MFGYDIKGFGSGFSDGAAVATGLLLREVRLVSVDLVRAYSDTYRMLTSERAIAIYRAVVTAVMCVGAFFYVLGVLTRQWLDAIADDAAEVTPAVVDAASTAFRWVRSQVTFQKVLGLAIQVSFVLVLVIEGWQGLRRRVRLVQGRLA
jgi:hypothetical protein